MTCELGYVVVSAVAGLVIFLYGPRRAGLMTLALGISA